MMEESYPPELLDCGAFQTILSRSLFISASLRILKRLRQTARRTTDRHRVTGKQTDRRTFINSDVKTYSIRVVYIHKGVHSPVQYVQRIKMMHKCIMVKVGGSKKSKL